jgi:hypothetical protein
MHLLLFFRVALCTCASAPVSVSFVYVCERTNPLFCVRVNPPPPPPHLYTHTRTPSGSPARLLLVTSKSSAATAAEPAILKELGAAGAASAPATAAKYVAALASVEGAAATPGHLTLAALMRLGLSACDRARAVPAALRAPLPAAVTATGVEQLVWTPLGLAHVPAAAAGAAPAPTPTPAPTPAAFAAPGVPAAAAASSAQHRSDGGPEAGQRPPAAYAAVPRFSSPTTLVTDTLRMGRDQAGGPGTPPPHRPAPAADGDPADAAAAAAAAPAAVVAGAGLEAGATASPVLQAALRPGPPADLAPPSGPVGNDGGGTVPAAAAAAALPAALSGGSASPSPSHAAPGTLGVGGAGAGAPAAAPVPAPSLSPAVPRDGGGAAAAAAAGDGGQAGGAGGVGGAFDAMAAALAQLGRVGDDANEDALRTVADALRRQGHGQWLGVGAAAGGADAGGAAAAGADAGRAAVPGPVPPSAPLHVASVQTAPQPLPPAQPPQALPPQEQAPQAPADDGAADAYAGDDGPPVAPKRGSVRGARGEAPAARRLLGLLVTPESPHDVLRRVELAHLAVAAAASAARTGTDTDTDAVAGAAEAAAGGGAPAGAAPATLAAGADAPPMPRRAQQWTAQHGGRQGRLVAAEGPVFAGLWPAVAAELAPAAGVTRPPTWTMAVFGTGLTLFTAKVARSHPTVSLLAVKPGGDEVADQLALAEALGARNTVVASASLTPARVGALLAVRDPFRYQVLGVDAALGGLLAVGSAGALRGFERRLGRVLALAETSFVELPEWGRLLATLTALDPQRVRAVGGGGGRGQGAKHVCRGGGEGGFAVPPRGA